MLLNLIFPPPPNLSVTAMSVVSVVSLANAGFQEIRGNHLKYSKFWNVVTNNNQENYASLSSLSINNRSRGQVRISSRIGMLMLYTPAFLAGLASFVIFPNDSFRFLLVKLALTLHFFKRDLEVLFLHKYSGGMILDSVLPITLSYTISTITMLYAQNLTLGISNPSIDLTYPGILLFLVGIFGNFFHHISLSKLRENGDRVQYKIPRGGMFDFVICPHYLFEILIFVGIAFISQTLYAFSFAMGTAFYLIGRSYATRRWYLSKFDDFPKNVKALIPFVF